MESMLTWALDVQIQKLPGKFYLCIKITKSLTILKSCIPYFMLCPDLKEASGKLMKVLKRATKPKRCVWVKVHELDLFDLPKTKLSSDLITTFKHHHKEKLQDIKDLFTLVGRSIKRIHGWNLIPEKMQMRHKAHTSLWEQQTIATNRQREAFSFFLHSDHEWTSLWKAWASWTKVMLWSNKLLGSLQL